MRAPHDIVCCPLCAGELDLETGRTHCRSCQTAYGIVGGVPNLVVGESAVDASRPGRRLLHEIAADSRAYDAIQRMAGRELIKARIAPALSETKHKTVLDVGAGTGAMASLLDETARYIWLDSDPRKLDGFASASADGEAVLSNALRMGIRERSVDVAVCSAVSHHVDDVGLTQLVAELGRVVRERLFFLDAVRTRSPVGSMLWRLDRGAYPRTAETLLDALDERFEIERADRFTILHRYLFVIVKPKEAT